MLEVTKEMDKINQDQQYINIVSSILNKSEFEKLKIYEHHGISRYDHSLKVSYYSYKISKLLHLDYNKTARAALLHDFFHNEENWRIKDRVKSTFNHPKKAIVNSKELFMLCEKEEDMIRSHMFPVTMSVPKYAESWIVNLVDKGVALTEFTQKFGARLTYLSSLYIFFIINVFK